jgi:RimJ/RimL family protein N-acetyltransferase
VISLIRPVNTPSQRVALRIGLKPEKMTMFRDYEHLFFSMSRPAASGCGA